MHSESELTELRAWCRLVFFSSLSRGRVRKVLPHFALPQDIFTASNSTLSAYLTHTEIEALRHFDETAAAAIDNAIAWLNDQSHFLLSLSDANYPQRLLELPDPPLLLFVLGQVELLNLPSIAIVGSRNATAQGVRDTENMARELVEQGQIIVSGLAEGIDAAAHRGAINAVTQNKQLPTGATIAVIGTGIDLVYPAKHRELAHDVAKNGAIVSEFMLGSKAITHHFPQRNRIISGLAQGVLVMEAALKSGSLITAKMAAEQGREVFAVPGSIHSPLARGCHALIRQGAKLVETAQDVLEELSLPYRTDASTKPALFETPKPKSDQVTQTTQATLGDKPISTLAKTADNDPQTAIAATPLSDQELLVTTASTNEAELLNHMGFAPISVDRLCAVSSLPSQKIIEHLLDWELSGWVQKLPGGIYQRIQT